tara:strand:- start:873 stop:1004 length:132 start_codon:yes stop_codon:yes gene_type:complete
MAGNPDVTLTNAASHVQTVFPQIGLIAEFMRRRNEVVLVLQTI